MQTVMKFLYLNIVTHSNLSDSGTSQRQQIASKTNSINGFAAFHTKSNQELHAKYLAHELYEEYTIH